MDNNYPPYAFLDENGTMQGILIDQWKAWEKHTGVQVEIVGLAWDDALTAMENGEYDVIDTIFFTEERSKIYDFTEPYADINVRIFFPTTVSGIANADNLQGFRVAVKAGDANAEYLLEHGVTSLAYYNSYETIIRAAADKKETIFVVDEPPALYFLYKYGVQDQFNYSEPLYGAAFHRAVKKGDTATLNLVKEGFDKISGAEYRAIDTRWFGSRLMTEFNRFLPYLGTGAVFALIVFSVLIAFNRTLQHRIKSRTQELEDALHHLNENRIFLAELIENSGALIYVKDRLGRYELVNRKWEEVTGFKRDIAIGKTVEEIFSETESKQFHTNDTKAMDSGEAIEVEEILNTPQGPRYFISIIFPLHDENGKVKGLCGMSTDITGRKQAEDALRENEIIFASFLEYSPVYIFFKDKDIRSLRLSKNYEGMLGMPLSQILGKTMDELFPSDLAKTMVEDDLRILNQGQRVDVVEEFAGRIYETTKFPIYKDGKPHMLAGFTLDITERTLAEQALQESEEKFRKLFENMNDGFALHKIILDENNKPVDYEFIEANPIFLERIGMKAEDLLNHTALELFPKTEQAWIDTFGQVALSGQPMRFTNYSVEMNRYYETRLYCPRPGYFAGLFTDITEQTLAEIEREKLIKELSEKNAELERFTYTVSHDLKSPIVTIRGFLGYLEEDALKGDRVNLKKDIQRITDATEKMRNLLDDLLELSRIGRMMNAPETFSFTDLLRDVLDIIYGQVHESKITVQVQSNLPNIYGDRQRLAEVLQNLLENAIKYMGDQAAPRIEIGQKGEDTERGMPIFFVRDNGIGIDPEYHERIFGLFNKLDAKSEGTGIGLALVKRIIEVHGGQVWVESATGEGSTFFFSLPVK